MNPIPTLDSSEALDEAAGASPSRPKHSALRRVLLVLAFLALAAAIVLWWKRTHPGPDAHSPLEATTSAGSVLVPAESELARAPTAAGSASASVEGAGLDASEPGALTKFAIAAASGSGQALEGAREALQQLTMGLNRAHARIDEVEASDRAQSEQIATLRSDVDSLKAASPPVVAAGATVLADAAPRAASFPTEAPGDRGIEVVDRATAPAARAAPPKRQVRQQPARPTTSSRATRAQDNGGTGADVLAIDTWGGKPSVALVTAQDGRPALRFLAEGEAHQGLVLQHADSTTQRARFSTARGDLTLAPKEATP